MASVVSTTGANPRADGGATTADVAVVVVVHNSTDVLAACLAALAAAAEQIDALAIVIDSGSSDDPGPICREHGVALVRVPNRGLGAAFNQALARDEVRRARYVLQLNPDVELPAGGLDALVARADELPGCGVLAPRQVDQHGDLIHSIGLEPTAGRYLRASNPYHDRWVWVRDSERYRAECEADWIMGACLLLRREMLTATGGFDERFFYSSEEVDLCRRSREAGWSVNYLPDVTVVHPLAGRPLDPDRVRLEEWSRILYIRKWLDSRSRRSMRFALVVRYALLTLLEARGPGPSQYNRVRLSVALRPRWGGRGSTERPVGELIEILTMTDLRFLPLTLSLHRSLLAHARDFRLTVLCMDDVSASFLRRSRLQRVKLVELAELEASDPELAALRDHRSWREYCWTATPAFCHHSLVRAPAGAVVLWSDSDVEFMRDPMELVDQLEDGSCLLTPHRYNRAYPISAPGWELTKLYGRFNGGSIAFRNDAQGLAAARLWRERSLAWCFDRCEPGRYGNQLHLDDFPELFSRARVLVVPGGVLGPWNGGSFRVRRAAGGPTADGKPVFAYHYQSLRLGRASPGLARRLAPNVFRLPRTWPALQARAEPHYRVSASERRVFWRPFARRLQPAVAEVLGREPRYADTLDAAAPRSRVLESIHGRWRLESSRVVAPYKVSGFLRAVRGRLVGRSARS